MRYAEDYYVIYQYQNPNVNFTKRVYLATDEPSVFGDARTKYEKLRVSKRSFYLCPCIGIRIMYSMVMQR
jgi:hypothetical protein